MTAAPQTFALALTLAFVSTACLRSTSECASSRECDPSRECRLGQCVLTAGDAGGAEDASSDSGQDTDADADSCSTFERSCQGSCAICPGGEGTLHECEGASCVAAGCAPNYEVCEDGCCLAPPNATFMVGDAPALALRDSLDIHANLDGSLWISFIDADGALGVANWSGAGWEVEAKLGEGCAGKSSITVSEGDDEVFMVAATCGGKIQIYDGKLSELTLSALTQELSDVTDPLEFEIFETPTMRAIVYTVQASPGSIEITAREIGEDPDPFDVLMANGGVSQLGFEASDSEVTIAWVDRGGVARANVWRADSTDDVVEGWATTATIAQDVTTLGLTTSYTDGVSALTIGRTSSSVDLHQIFFQESEAAFTGPNSVAEDSLIGIVPRAAGAVGVEFRAAFGLFGSAGGVSYVEELEGSWRVRTTRVECDPGMFSPRAFALTRTHIVGATVDVDGALCVESDARSPSARPR